jgi:hypothetical protein
VIMLLRGIDGSNPLAFLASIGAMRLIDDLWRDQRVRIRWVRTDAWRPEFGGLPTTDEEELCRALHDEARWAPLGSFEALGNNLTVSRDVFEAVVRGSAVCVTSEDRRMSDFAAAFGSEILEEEKEPRIQTTDFCFIRGSGNQDFLRTARILAQQTEVVHLHEALFGPWRYRKHLSMRWDPEDAKAYALQWKDPGPAGAAAVWGANRLAFEGLPMFPTLPTLSGLRTTGFETHRGSPEFTWPIWTEWAGTDTVRSLVSLRELQSAEPDHIVLGEMGVTAVFRATRVRIGQGGKFKLSFRPARAV